MGRERIEEIKLDYEKALREKTNLEKILERRRKLNLLVPGEEADLKDDIRNTDETIRNLRMKYRRIEAEKARSKIIRDSGDKAPWED